MKNQPSYVQSMKLNNLAVFYARKGKYDLAIQSLAEALHFSEYPVEEETCTCEFCCFEACMGRCQMNQSSGIYRQSSLVRQQQQTNAAVDCRIDSVTVEGSGQCLTKQEEEQEAKGQKQNQDSLKVKNVIEECPSKSLVGGLEVDFVYQKMIRFSHLSIQFRHNPGVSLSIIIIFNLALAYHLTLLRESKRQIGRFNQGHYRKALKSYQLAYQMHVKRDEEEADYILFPMIVASNLAQIHKLAKDIPKHELGLNQLLCFIMYCIDSGDIDLVPTWCMDGFVQNTTKLILQSNVAAAA